MLKDANKEGVAAPTMPVSAVAPVKPSRPRLIVQDATPEGVAAVLVSNDRLLSRRTRGLVNELQSLRSRRSNAVA